MGSFFPSFFSLYKQVLDYWMFINEMYNWRAPLRLFSSNYYREQRGIHANLSREKSFLFCVNHRFLFRFREFSKRANVEWNFISFTFASQWNLFEFLSYGEYNHLFISVICFLKTTHLSVYRFNSLVVFLMSNRVYPNHFSAIEKYWSQQQSF